MDKISTAQIVTANKDGTYYLQIEQLGDLNVVHVYWISHEEKLPYSFPRKPDMTLTFDEMAELCAAFEEHCPPCSPDDVATLTAEAQAQWQPQPKPQPSPAP